MKILCCLCGTSIEPNDAAMCIDCLRAEFDITGGLERNGEVVQCRKCERWHIKQDQWTYYPLESAGLLSACLRKIAGLGSGSMKLIDAAWVWTEPHSDRLKISVEVEHGVLDNKVQLRQKAVIEFVIKHKQCMECIREATDHSWGAMIQIRQKVGHKQALFLLEDLLTKAGLHNLMISITVCKEGLDLFFKARNQAEIVVNFISSHMPVKVKKSQKLISRDQQSNFSRFEITYHLEIAPVCKGDLVVTSKELSGSADLMVVTKLSSSVHLLSPTTLQKSELNSQKIFSTSPKLLTTVLTAKHLTSFVVLDINPVSKDTHLDSLESDNGKNSRISAVKEAGGLLAEAEVRFDAVSLILFTMTPFDNPLRHITVIALQIARELDLGVNDTTYRVLTHMGHLLQSGDSVLGYDLCRAIVDDEILERLTFQHPDIVLVKKIYPDKVKNASKKQKRRNRRGKAKQEKPSAIPEEHEDIEDTPPPVLKETTADATADDSDGEVEIDVDATVDAKKIMKTSTFGWTEGDEDEYQEFHRNLESEDQDEEEMARMIEVAKINKALSSAYVRPPTPPRVRRHGDIMR